MQLLGEFPSDLGNKYIDLLNDKQIEFGIEDVFEDRFHGRSLSSSLDQSVKLYAKEENYEKQLEQQTVISGKAADNAMVKVLVGIVCIGILFYLVCHFFVKPVGFEMRRY